MATQQSDVANLTFEPDLWEISENSEYCVCGVPSTENLVACNGTSCPIGFFHRQCVGLDNTTDAEVERVSPTTARPTAKADATPIDWVCEFCGRDEHLDSASKPAEDHCKTSKGTAGQLKHQTPSETAKETSSRGKRAKFKAPILSDEELSSEASNIMREAILQLTTDLLYEDTLLGKEVISLAREILSLHGIDAVSSEIVGKLHAILSSAEDKVIGPLANTHIFREFHKYRASAQCDATFQRIVGSCTEYSDTCKSYFQQYVLRAILGRILKTCQDEGSLVEENAPLSVHDEQVLRYISGYIPHALLKRYRKMNTEQSKKIVAFLLQWKGNDQDTHADSFLEYTSVWITLQNRGGLFLVSDIAYQFFRAMEIVTKKHLTATRLQDKNETLKEQISKHIYGSVYVHNTWNRIASDLEPEESDALLGSVVNYWIKIRINAYVRAFVIMLRESDKKAKKGKKALRKELKKQAKK